MHGASSIFSSAVAEDWLTLLVALEQPRQAAVRQAALTCFFGWTFADLAQADRGRPGRPHAADPLVEPHPGQPRGRCPARGGHGRRQGAGTAAGHPGWRAPADRPAASGAECCTRPERPVSSASERLVEWLRSRMAEARGNGSDDETRRLETDAQAVTILTVHRSKGLEFPIVYLPEAWDRHVSNVDEGRILRLHEPGHDGGLDCVLDVGGRYAPGRSARFDRYRAEEAGEDLRLAYVALTRAQCQVVTWWAASHNTPASALQRFLRRSPGEAAEPLPAYPIPTGPVRRPAASPRGQRRVRSGRAPGTAPEPPSRPRPDELAVRHLRSDPRPGVAAHVLLGADRCGARSGGTAARSEQRARGRTRRTTSRPAPAGAPVAPGSPRRRPRSPHPRRWPGCRSGRPSAPRCTRCSSWPTADAPDLPGELRRACAVALARSPNSSITVEDLTTGLLPVVRYSAGPAGRGPDAARDPDGRPARRAGLRVRAGRRRCDQRRGQRRHAGRRCSAGTCPPTIRWPATPARSTSRRLADQALRGFLTGSIDAVLRIADPDGEPRYLVVDYKTNWLGPLGRRGADPGRLHAGPAGGGDDRRPLSAAGAALLGRAAPAAALATARLRPGASPRRRPLPLRPRHGRADDAAGRPECPAGCSAGGRRRRWWPSCPTCWTGRHDAVSTAGRRAGDRRRDVLASTYGGDRAARRVQRGRGAGRRRRAHRRRHRPDRRRARRAGACWRWPWPSGRCATVRCAST